MSWVYHFADVSKMIGTKKRAIQYGMLLYLVVFYKLLIFNNLRIEQNNPS